MQGILVLALMLVFIVAQSKSVPTPSEADCTHNSCSTSTNTYENPKIDSGLNTGEINAVYLRMQMYFEQELRARILSVKVQDWKRLRRTDGLQELEKDAKRAKNLAKARKISLLKDGYVGWLIQRDWEGLKFTVQGLESGLNKWKAKEAEINKLLNNPIEFREHILAFWMDYADELQKQVDALLEAERDAKGRKKAEKKNRKGTKFNPFNVQMQEIDVIRARIELQASFNNYIAEKLQNTGFSKPPVNV